jgi:hypothetical protein
MNARNYAMVGGTIMLVMGVLAFVPMLNAVPLISLPSLWVNTSYGLFLGVLPMNIFNKLALIAFGIAGILAANAEIRSVRKSVLWSRAVFYVMGIAAILGMFPLTNTLYGYWPLFGGEVWAHGIFAVLGGYYGYSLQANLPGSNRHTPVMRM